MQDLQTLRIFRAHGLGFTLGFLSLGFNMLCSILYGKIRKIFLIDLYSKSFVYYNQ